MCTSGGPSSWLGLNNRAARSNTVCVNVFEATTYTAYIQREHGPYGFLTPLSALFTYAHTYLVSNAKPFKAESFSIPLVLGLYGYHRAVLGLGHGRAIEGGPYAQPRSPRSSAPRTSRKVPLT